MSDEMTLAEFGEEETRRVNAFVKAWREAGEKSPDIFPATMPPGEWDEALSMWDGEPFDVFD